MVTALVVVDMQEGLDDPSYGRRNNPSCEANIATLMACWRAAGAPVVFTRHLSGRQGSPLCEDDPRSRIKRELSPMQGEMVCDKRTNSAFKSAGFVRALDSAGVGGIVFVGLATDICITACAREARDLGYEVTVVPDACAAFSRVSNNGQEFPAELVHDVALASLSISGIRLARTNQAIASATNSTIGKVPERSPSAEAGPSR